jgi:hypothetical protein
MDQLIRAGVCGIAVDAIGRRQRNALASMIGMNVLIIRHNRCYWHTMAF